MKYAIIYSTDFEYKTSFQYRIFSKEQIIEKLIRDCSGNIYDYPIAILKIRLK